MSGLFEWDVDFEEVLEFTHPSALNRVDRAVEKALEKEMTLAVERARDTDAFVDRTGALRDSIAFEIEGSVSSNDVTVRLFAAMDYGGFIEDGTAAHIIEPSSASVLHWSDGGEVFAKKVRHPGIRPRKFLAAAMNFVDIEIAVGKAVTQALKSRR